MFCKEKVSFYNQWGFCSFLTNRDKKSCQYYGSGKIIFVTIYNIDLFQRIVCEFAPCLYDLLLLIHE